MGLVCCERIRLVSVVWSIIIVITVFISGWLLVACRSYIVTGSGSHTSCWDKSVVSMILVLLNERFSQSRYGEGPYLDLLLVKSGYYHTFKTVLRHYA